MNTAYDPMDKLIADHIAEARDLRLHLRPAYTGVHEFSIGFENKMERLRQHGHSEWLTRLILVAILTALCAMTAQAGLGERAGWHLSLNTDTWHQTFAFDAPASPGIQAGDLHFSNLPPNYTQMDRAYERNYYTIRLAAADEELPVDPHRMTSLTVSAYWLDSNRLTSTLHNPLVTEAESLRIGESDALLLTQRDGSLNLRFLLDGFEVVIHAARLTKAELVAFAEGIHFK